MKKDPIKALDPAPMSSRSSPRADAFADGVVEHQFRRWFWPGAAIVALPALVIYYLTLEPSVYFVDSGGFLATIKVFGVDYAPGFPLYILLATAWTHLAGLAPGFLTFTQAVNYFSGIAAAATAAIIYAVTFELTSVESFAPVPEPRNTGRPDPTTPKSRGRKGHRNAGSSKTRFDETNSSGPRPDSLMFRPVGGDRRWLAWASAVFAGWLTAFAYTIWSQAITAAPYTLEGMFSALVLYLAIRLWRAEPIAAQPTPSQRRLILGIVAAYGCAWAVHYVALGLLPFFLLLIYRYRVLLRNRRLLWVGMATFLLFGALPYVYEPIRSAAWPVVDWGHPADLHNLLLQLTGATWTTRPSNFRIFDPIKLAPAIGHWAVLTFYQFLPVTLAPMLAGWWFIYRRYRPLFVPLLLFYVGSVAVPVAYVTNNDESYLIPAHIVLPVAAAVGLVYGLDGLGGFLRRYGHSWLDGSLALGTLGAVAVVLVAGAVIVNYPALDRHDNYVVEDYAKNALRGVPRNGIILVRGDELNAAILYLQVVLNYRPDVTAISESIVDFDWWRESFRHNNPSFYLPEIPLTGVSSDAQWMSEFTAGLIEHNPGRAVYVLTLSGRQIPDGYTPVPAGIGYRLVAVTDAAGLKIRRDDWSFPPSSLGEVMGHPHFLQTAYNIFLHEIQLAYMQAFQNLGDHDLVAGSYAQAASDYASGLRFVPEQAELRLGEGASLAKTGQVQLAWPYLPVDALSQGAAGPSADAQAVAAFGSAFNAIGDRMYQQGNQARALEDYRLAYLLSPTDPDVIANWGAALALQNDQPQALSVLQKGIAIAPNNAKLYFNLGQVDRSLHNDAESKQMFTKAFALDPQLQKLLGK